MKNKILGISVFFFALIGLISCDTEPLDSDLGPDPGSPGQTALFTVNYNDVNYSTNNVIATVEDGRLTITAVSSEGIFILKSQGLVTGNYTNSQLDFLFTDIATSGQYFSVHPISGISNSQLTLTSVNFQFKKITGTFSFTGYKVTTSEQGVSTEQVEFSQGTFQNITYTVNGGDDPGDPDPGDPDPDPDPQDDDYFPMAVDNIWNYTTTR